MRVIYVVAADFENSKGVIEFPIDERSMGSREIRLRAQQVREPS